MFTQARATAVAASRSTDPRLSASKKARNGVRKARDQRVSPEKSSRCVGIAWKYPANADGPPGKPGGAEVRPRIPFGRTVLASVAGHHRGGVWVKAAPGIVTCSPEGLCWGCFPGSGPGGAGGLACPQGPGRGVVEAPWARLGSREDACRGAVGKDLADGLAGGGAAPDAPGSR